MLVSIFKDLTFTTWIDYSSNPETSEWNPDCVECVDVDFNPLIETLEIEETDGEYVVNIMQLPQAEESSETRHARIYQSILEAEILDLELDLEWEEFTDFEIGEIITTRLFGGNPHAQTALLRKIAKVQNLLIAWEELTEEMQGTLDYANEIDSEIDSIINFFYT